MRLDKILKEAVYPVGKMLRENAFDYGSHEWKGENDPVTMLDKEAEMKIKQRILLQTPANFIGEEQGYEDNGADLTFIIDPIDGTKSFMRRDFHSSISVAAEYRGDLVAGCVYDFMRDIMYLGTDTNTVIHQGKAIDIDRTSRFSRYRVSFEEPIDIHPQISSTKRIGSIALAMVQLAMGNYDGAAIISERGNVWDIAAGYHILKNEDRFYITDGFGDPFDYKDQSRGIIALGYHIPQELRSLVSQAAHPIENKYLDDH